MYLVGGSHPRKTDAQMILERLVVSGERLVSDAEVLQEVLHRYTAINKRDAIDPAIRVMLDVVDEIFPIEKRDVLRAAEIARSPSLFSARDAVHISVMERHGVSTILTFDADYDRWPGLKRLYRI